MRLKRELEKLNNLYGSIASTIENGLVNAKLYKVKILGMELKLFGDVARSVFGEIQRPLSDLELMLS